MTITKTKILGTTITVYAAYEPYAGHSTFTHLNGVRVGRVGSRQLPAELDALKSMSTERSTRVRAWQAAQYEEAYAAIIAECPEATNGERSMGEIEVRS